MTAIMKKSVAIIGSGIAGLATARIFKDADYDVTIFEALPQRGMDSHTIFLSDGIVDVPLRVMSPLIWKNTLALAAHAGVGTFKVDTFISCSWLTNTESKLAITPGKLKSTWFRTKRLPFSNLPALGNWRNINRHTFIIIKEFLRLTLLTQGLKRQDDQILTLAQFLQQHSFHPLFWRGVILPILTTICTCDESYLMAWPALKLLEILDQIMHGKSLVRLQGGTPALVNGLAKGIQFISGSPVTALKYVKQENAAHDSDSQVQVSNARGDTRLFDYAVVATPTNQLSFLDAQQFSRELSLLKQFKFDQGELWVHQDPRFMPEQQKDWTALNYQIKPDLSQSMFTVWVNAVEPTLKNSAPVFQTWNPLFKPSKDSTMLRTPLLRAVVDRQSQQALATLEAMHQEAERQVFFAGSWASLGIPLLESAVQSAMRVAQHLKVPIAFGTSQTV